MVEPQPDEDSPVQAPAPAPSRASVGLATLALVLAAAALAGILWMMLVNDKLQAKVKDLEARQADDDKATAQLKDGVHRLGNAVTALSDEQLDLMNSGLQQLRYGFAVSELAIARQDTGVAVVGRVINASAIGYRGAIFKMKAGNSSQQFSVPVLAPGSSARFQLVLPNLPLENARTASFFFSGASGVDYDR
jgi:hypothetical protein